MTIVQRLTACVLATALLGGLGGCGKQNQTAAALSALEQFEPNQVDPLATTDSLIRLLELQVEHGVEQHPAAAKAYDEVLNRLVDGDTLYKVYASSVPKPEPREEVLPQIIDYWPALIANYVGRLSMADAVGPQPQIAGNGVAVFVPVTDERVLLRVHLTPYDGVDASWRVARVEFIAPSALPKLLRPTTQPTTQPTTPQPAAQPAAS